MAAPPIVETIFVGGPKTRTDAQGQWESSIQRERTPHPVQVTSAGISGDKVTQPYHGGPNAALCVHLSDHYRFWQTKYGITLQPGAVGENLTLAFITEDDIFAGDIVRLGTTLAQVSGPRVPCANLARHIGRSDFVRLTIRENRTGFYMRILEPGILQPGDPWLLEDRLNEDASIPTINACMYLNFTAAYATHMQSMRGLGDWWKQQAAEKLAAREPHWTEGMQNA